MKKFITGLMILMVCAASSGVALAHCGKCGMDGEHGDKKECTMSADKKQCSMKKDKKSCETHCSKPCCNKAKTNFGPRKR